MSERKICKECGRDLPIEAFYRIREGSYRGTCRRCILDADAVRRRAAGAHVRHPRRNARGQVWCNRCQLAALPELRGRPLACWCRHDGEPWTAETWCHADVLVGLLDRYTDDELRAMGGVQ